MSKDFPELEIASLRTPGLVSSRQLVDVTTSVIYTTGEGSSALPEPILAPILEEEKAKPPISKKVE